MKILRTANLGLNVVENPWESHGKPKGKTKRATATIYAVCDVK